MMSDELSDWSGRGSFPSPSVVNFPTMNDMYFSGAFVLKVYVKLPIFSISWTSSMSFSRPRSTSSPLETHWYSGGTMILSREVK
jgi:hypothetical protein